MKNIYYYLAFSHFLGIGPMRFRCIMERYGDVKKGYEAPIKDIKELFGPSLATRFDQFRSTFSPQKKFQTLLDKNIETIPCNDIRYPPQLLTISDPPICLYAKGDLKRINFSKDHFIGIVGTRKPTSYGQQVARIFSQFLSMAGFVIVSGMAMGIDAISHKAALDAERKTIAVLGCGVDIIYPPINKNIYDAIIATGGLVLSEFPPGHTVLPGLFVARNRLISGLSKGILVIEGAKDSGAFITARYAAEQGKDVFAPPAPITSAMSEAPNTLLKQGAKLVTSPEEIIEEFGLRVIPEKKREIETQLSQEERKIYQFISTEPRLIDEIVQHLCFSVESVSGILSTLELKGVVEKNEEGKYQMKY